MQTLKNITTTTIALCATLPLFGLEIGDQINLSGGYRNDAITSFNKIYASNGSGSYDWFKVEDLNIGEIGLNFRWTMPECECSESHPLLDNFYLFGDAYWGWSGESEFYRKTSNFAAGATLTSTFISHGDQRARTEDFEIGAGFLFWNCDCWALGITGGYAYDWQRIRTKHGKTADESGPYLSDDLYNGLVLKQRWQGPWVGADFFYSTCGTLINIGYAYHFAHYHADFNIPNNPIAQEEDFSDSRNGLNGYGNEVYVTAQYPICENILIGLGLNYKQYLVRHAHLHAKGGSFTDLGYASGTVGRASAKWTTYSILADVGYSF